MNFQILFDLGTMNREGPWAGGLIFPQVWTAALIQLPPLKIIMQTAKFNGVNPQACLLQTLTKVSEGHLIRRVDAMLR